MALVAAPAAPSPMSPTPAAYRAAGFWRRFAAALIDLILLAPLIAVGGILTCLAFGQPLPRLGELSPDLLIAALIDGNSVGEAALLLGGALGLLYFFIFHATRG